MSPNKNFNRHMSYIVSYKEPDRAVPEAGPGAVPGDFMSCSW